MMSEAARINRQTRNMVIGFMTVISVALLGLGYFANEGREADNENQLSSDVQFAQNARSACVTAKTNDRQAAQYEVSSAAFFAVKAANEGDDEEYARQTARGERADERGQEALEALEPENLNKPPPVGCGPPITSEDDLANLKEDGP